jgi:anaerobic ribonucleoside-triphosphate reductase activating protein
MRRVKAECPGKDVWAYTGYVLDRDLVPGGKCCTADTAELLHMIDVLVDGPFVTELHDISLLFKGSSNQRVIDCAEYCRSGEIRELM